MNIYQTKGFLKTNEAAIKDSYVLWLSGLRHHYHDDHILFSQSNLYTLTIEFVDASPNDIIVRYYYDEDLLNDEPIQIMHYTKEGFEVMAK